MLERPRALAVVFDTSRSDFDAASIFAVLREKLETKVWNFIPGMYVVRTTLGTKELREALEGAGRHLILEMDPATVEGSLPEAAWDSWFLDIFGEDLEHICETNGWNVEIVQSARAKMLAKE